MDCVVTPLKTLMGFSVHLNVQLKFYNLPIKKNTSVIVQQNWMAKEFKKMYNIGNIIVAKPSFHLETIVKKSKPKNKEYKFLYPSFARPYKNFELACEAAKELWQKTRALNCL